MRLTILGCGTSTGVPAIQCSCNVCRSKHPRNKRLRTSAWLQINQKSILIDTSPDLRTQALRADIPRVDAVLYTHPHADHIHGIDELRSYNFIQKDPIPVYGNQWTCHELKKKFPYAFKQGKTEGGGAPSLKAHLFNASSQFIKVLGLKFIPISLNHGSKECIGYRFDSLAYVTDCSSIPENSMQRLTGLTYLILDCVRIQPHRTHLTLDQALEIVSVLKPKKTYLTHLGHELDYSGWRKKLPKGVFFAYDGLIIDA